jgi:FixJ family two-component response regulator
MNSLHPCTGSGATALVIIVDDDAYVRSSLENLLASVGYATASAHSAEAFLASEYVLAGDCLILDVRMKGMTGLELQQELNSLGSRTPVIFLTGHCDDDTRKRALKGGAWAFMGKPFEEKELLEAIETALDGHVRPPA